MDDICTSHGTRDTIVGLKTTSDDVYWALTHLLPRCLYYSWRPTPYLIALKPSHNSVSSYQDHLLPSLCQGPHRKPLDTYCSTAYSLLQFNTIRRQTSEGRQQLNKIAMATKPVPKLDELVPLISGFDPNARIAILDSLLIERNPHYVEYIRANTQTSKPPLQCIRAVSSMAPGSISPADTWSPMKKRWKAEYLFGSRSVPCYL